jgi:hypothetical protein
MASIECCGILILHLETRARLRQMREEIILSS